MRKASKVLYLVAAILSIVVAVELLISGIILVVVPNTDAFREAFNEAWARKVTPDVTITLEQAFEAAKAGMIAGGIVCFVWTGFSAINSVFAFRAFNATKNGKPSKALNVINIVFGALSCVVVNVVAAIFAFVANGQEERRQALKEKE